MLETSFGLTFFLKTPEKPSNIRFIYLRITVDGIPKEKSTKRKWDIARWDQKAERAIGTKEDARAINMFLDTMISKINQIKLDMMCNDRTITSQRIMDSVLGKTADKAKVLEEFQLHNDEMLALVGKGEFALGTHN
ncbi:Arm DNA-binding domain-containing protein [Flavobacterium cerinum]|uniref:Arm DNA-binding domain-containing protein n=1 Tax=Flavobacterium cerinum TaxID=2502784 RepID=UPI001F4FC6A4|nr:Arm DNA-binding domain-containing protein [Flavobacterium cerinum]